MNNFELLIDAREVRLIQECKLLGLNYKVCTLALGDIVIGNYIIERKTIADLTSSIIDGRYEEQKCRLREAKKDGAQIIYIIEGVPDSKTYNGSIASAVASIGLEFMLISSKNLSTTAAQLAYISTLLEKGRPQNLEIKSTESIALQQKKGARVADPYTNLLCALPGISIVTCRAIMDKYPTWPSFVKALSNPQELASCGAKKKISMNLINKWSDLICGPLLEKAGAENLSLS